jgi:hypothetical protein
VALTDAPTPTPTFAPLHAAALALGQIDAEAWAAMAAQTGCAETAGIVTFLTTAGRHLDGTVSLVIDEHRRSPFCTRECQ